MTSEQAQRIWQKIVALWPKWKTTGAIAAAWAKAFATYSFDAAFDALDVYYVDHSSVFEPVLKDVLKLADEASIAEKSQSQREFEKRFFSMTKLEQVRAMRDAYQKRADATSDERHKANMLRLRDFAAAQARRLYDLHREDCPPMYGPDTSRGVHDNRLFGREAYAE